ncbi:MAG: insulinase family protein [Rhodospirillaceae bacterium]|nr:insulinase family protein [Rhodospirillaceae bacterium]
MTMRKLLILNLALILFVLSVANSRAEVFSPVRFYLANGLEVAVIPNHRSPVVMQMIWYKVGSIDEPPGKSGIAHLLEHLMFKGTNKHPDGEFSKLVARNGGNENAFTSFDYTGYHQTVASDRLEMIMELESDRMTGLTLSKKDIETESDVILEERRQRVGNNPAGKLRLEVNESLFPNNHPYGRPVIGLQGEVKSASRTDVLDFYKKYYVPSNAVLVVVGDVSPEMVRTLAEKYYGPIPAGKAPARPPLAMLDLPKSGEVIVRDNSVRQPAWSLNIIAPSLGNSSGANVAAYEVLATVLGDGTTSRMYKALVLEGGKAVAAGAGYSSHPKGPGRFVFYASPIPGIDLDVIADEIESEFDKFIKNGFAVGELERVKKRMLANAVYVRDSLKSGAWAVGGALGAGHDLNSVEQWPEYIQNVSETDVLEAAKKIRDESRRVTGKLLPVLANVGSGD